MVSVVLLPELLFLLDDRVLEDDVPALHRAQGSHRANGRSSSRTGRPAAPGQADGPRPAFRFGYWLGFVPSVAVTVRFDPLCQTSSFSLSPGCLPITIEKSCCTCVTGRPSMLVMMSPPTQYDSP